MYQNKIKNLKEEIKRTYQGYIGKTKDKKITILDVAKLFNIKLDESRLSDYQIIDIDYNDLSIEISDNKTKTNFVAEYSDTLGFVGRKNEPMFLNVISMYPSFKRKTLYDVDKGETILEGMTLMHGEDGLLLQKTMPDFINGFYKQDGTQFLTRYFKKDANGKDHGLLNIRYKKDYTHKDINSFECLNVASDDPMSYRKNKTNYLYFNRDETIIYGTYLENSKGRIEGACFEKLDSSGLNEAFNSPYSIVKIKNVSNIDESLENSAIIYAGIIYSNEKDYYLNHDLKINKASDGISINYSIKNIKHDDIFDTCYLIPSLDTGCITIREIGSIISELKNKFGEDSFISSIINDLIIFKEKLAIKNCLKQETQNLLSPKLLIDRPFDEICALIISNKDCYFDLIKNRFENEIGASKEENKVKVLK